MRDSVNLFSRLQARLFLGFLIVLFLTLCVIGAALMVFLRTRPINPQQTYNDLLVASFDLDLRADLQTWREANRPLTRQAETEYLQEAIAQWGAENGYRMLIVAGSTPDEGNPTIVYDTGNSTPNGFTEDAAALPLTRRDGLRAGQFVDENGQTWLYVRRAVIPGAVRQALAYDLIVATPQPRQTLRRVFADFRQTFFMPLCQAGIVGIVVAVGLSVGLSRSVARPLQNIAQAAGRVAQGDYEHHVPERGPAEARQLAQAFNEMTQQVKITQQAQQDFLANVTHDLRTPLTSIQGFSQAIIDGVAAQPESAQHAARIIHEEAGRLTRMVSDLLDLAKIQSGRMQMLRHAVDLDALLKRVGESMRVKASQKNVQLRVEVAPLVRIAGDADRLAQVFINLVDNALHHTPEGGQVWLSAALQHDGIEIRVQDTGEGIPAEDIKRIFERFYQVDKSRKKHGAGLGLAITHEIIAAHGGKISVESEVGVGTRFTVWLPVLPHDRSTIIRLRR